MLRSIDTINKNMNILEYRQQKTSSNIANAKTVGYKFQDMLQRTASNRELVNFSGGEDNNQLQEIGSLNLTNELDSVYRNMNQGSLKETGRNLDFALEEGFFTILLEDGSLGFTKNGNFKKDSNNALLTMDGNPVMGLDGNGNQIQINVLDTSQKIDFFAVDFDNYANLDYIGGTTFKSEDYNQIEASVEIGFLEMSNVDLAGEIVDMIGNLREIQANQRVIHAVDETLSKTVNEIGKV